MSKITKRSIDALQPLAGRDVFAWDGELRGFGVRVKPSGVKSYLVQYRNAEGRTRRLVVGQHGVLAPEQARNLARQKLAAAARGEDPSAERHAARDGLMVAEVCDWYLEQARSGRILGRRRHPIKASTLDSDESRIETHIKPLLGMRAVGGLTLRDVEGMQADIVAGKSARGRHRGRGGQTTGGRGVAGRTVSTLRSIFGHAMRLGLIETNPAAGVRQVAGEPRKRRLSEAELRRFGRTMRDCSDEGEHPVGLAAIQLMLLTGFRRMEALGLERAWLGPQGSHVDFPDTKGGAQVRVIGRDAAACIANQARRVGSQFVFPADNGDGHFVGVVRVLDRVCDRAGLADVTPHTLRHTFASLAGDLNFSELTIKGLLGHASRGVTQGYVHLDAALIVAADQVSRRMAELLSGKDVATRKMSREVGVRPSGSRAGLSKQLNDSAVDPACVFQPCRRVE